MNARKAVLADNPELILRVLQLRFDESLSYPRISAQTGISKTAIFSLVRRFHQVFTDWPLSGEYSCVQLARALFPGRYPSAPTVTQTVKTEKTRRNQFSPEFKWRLVQQTLLPGACVAQIARENGINDNLLFNWRHLWRNGGLQSPGEHETSLLPVTLTPEPDNKIPAPVQIFGKDLAYIIRNNTGIILPGRRIAMNKLIDIRPANFITQFSQRNGRLIAAH